MNTKKTQINAVRKQLLKTGKVDNIWAVRNYILRLSAIIFMLKAEGYTFKTYYKNVKGKTTRQFVYELVK